MEKLDLAGEWQLSRDGNYIETIPGKLPGCTYLDYMTAGTEDPFRGENETRANELARHDYRYSREFELTGTQITGDYLELVADGLDTLCTVAVNDIVIGKCDNINRIWRFDLKNVCKAGRNNITLDFADPYPVMEKKQKDDTLPMCKMPVTGVGHVRKTPCHFGWDWGPALPPTGLARGIWIEAYSVRIADLKINQEHTDGKVILHVCAEVADAAVEPDYTDGSQRTEAAHRTDVSNRTQAQHTEVSRRTGVTRITGRVDITDPEGRISSHLTVANGRLLQCDITINNPQLWWCNGLGGQSLYQLDFCLLTDGLEAHQVHRRIGLRTIALDTAPDAHGNQFRFVVNGVPVFAKGANWIPPDSFITRADRATMMFYIREAKRANMNMLRVWGGGMYENEDFYDACDENGILVWQDFAFACNMYPFHNPDFLDNVHAEVIDNIRRLRHRASLALWCGNNENEIPRLVSRLIKLKDPAYMNNFLFYHKTLRDWVGELDNTRPYWPGSPSSGSLEHMPHDLKEGSIRGDTHLWQIWHGMLPIESFRKYPTRFCSEYGMESMPSMHTIRSFTDDPEPSLFDSVMVLHQKCNGGNNKMLYYLLAKYRNPKKFADFVYLSQLVQANTIRFATDCWRRNIGRQNGALFWQMNDCWPVASWAGIDYLKQLKAVTYQARHFNKMLCLSNDYYDDRAELYIVNEYPDDFTGTLEWRLVDFRGKQISNSSAEVKVGSVSSLKVAVLKFSDILSGRSKNEAALQVRLLSNGEVMDEKYWLLVPDRKAALPEPRVKCECTVNGGARPGDAVQGSSEHSGAGYGGLAQGSTLDGGSVHGGVATVKVSAENYARYIYLEAEGVTAPWSDNFFDLPAGGETTVTVAVPDGMTTEEFQQKLTVKTLADVEPNNSRFKDRLLRAKMFMSGKNYLVWLVFKLFL